MRVGQDLITELFSQGIDGAPKAEPGDSSMAICNEQPLDTQNRAYVVVIILSNRGEPDQLT